MPTKTFNLPEIGEIKIVKKRGNRNIRLSFDSGGSLRVSLPAHAPYRAGLAFARQKQAWIAEHQPPAPLTLAEGQIIAGNYTLAFRPSADAKTVSARIKDSRILVMYPKELAITSEKVQAAAARGAHKAIKLEAGRILPPRLAELANQLGYKYKVLRIKPMRRRWGSCDVNGNITLNQFLVTLPPELIDYVLIHELVHTRNPHHQAGFWSAMERHLPNVKELKKRARASQPGLALAD